MALGGFRHARFSHRPKEVDAHLGQRDIVQLRRSVLALTRLKVG
jgi:hypothetical protein